MNFTDTLLSPDVQWFANILAIGLLSLALWRAPWRRLANTDHLNVWMGAVVALMLVWSIKTGVKPGLNFHILGSALLTLMFGPWLALPALALVLVAVTLQGGAGWLSLGVNFLLMAVLPSTISHGIFRLADRRLPNHFFIYILVNAFAGAGLSAISCGLAATALLALAGPYQASYLGTSYLPYFILMGWAEAMLSGMLMTLMVVYRPEWVGTFSDERYLKSK